VLQENVDIGIDTDDSACGQATHGVATLGWLDFDDLGAPVGEQG
jgi:hypothetical protein